jgi:hypothetical protein
MLRDTPKGTFGELATVKETVFDGIRPFVRLGPSSEAAATFETGKIGRVS